MAIVSSHLLNAVDGTHAANVDVTLTRIAPDGRRILVFQTRTDPGGRILETVGADAVDPGSQYELVFAIGGYFSPMGGSGSVIVSDVVLRFAMPRPEDKYHLPVIMAPHGYSVWWSK